jgi:hypothetical protein
MYCIEGPVLSEAFRTDQRPEEIDEQTQRRDSDNDVFHHGLNPPEGVDVKNTDPEKTDRGQNEDKVHHDSAPILVLVG